MNGKDGNNNGLQPVFIRRGQKGGLYFFSPSGNYIFYGRSEDVQAVIDGKKEWAMFQCRKVNKKQR